MLLHDNAHARSAIRVRQFLAQKMVAALDHPPYCHEMAPADFFLFLRLKAVIKGARFADINAIKRSCGSRSAVDSSGFCLLFPEAVRTLSNVCCSGWRLF